MDKWLRISILVLAVAAAFVIGVNIGLRFAEKYEDAQSGTAVKRNVPEADRKGCRIEIWESGVNAGKAVITTEIGNINELPGGILVICCRECEAYQVCPEACDDDECTEKYDEDKEP